MALQNSLRVSTFNCRSLKSSVIEICELCDSSDLVFLQEHWLLPFEFGLLNNIHSNFFAVSKSAVDTTRDVLVGRPYGGGGGVQQFSSEKNWQLVLLLLM
jgi:hypothetical protein